MTTTSLGRVTEKYQSRSHRPADRTRSMAATAVTKERGKETLSLKNASGDEPMN
jgi:hypothetical protein